jgi:hypothetical protein
MTRLLSIALAGLILLGCKGSSPVVRLDGGPGADAGVLPGITISGTVSGLSGSGLILRNNGGDALAVSRDGSFTFETQVKEGGTYNVDVLTQPSQPAQICNVANASGTARKNVTNVTVTCATSSFAVSGTVVGLSGSGLVLQDNGGDNLPVGKNGSFKFASKVLSGGTFSVTIANQPTSPAQTCSLLGNTGTVNNADVSTVVVNCGNDSFLIGGTVIGLAGAVSLQNDGTDTIKVTANGSFGFPKPLSSGTPYSVTVSQNPTVPDQVCTVTNGNGSVDNDNISDVVVNCTTQSFTIGGTLSGLGSNAQITLQDNGGDPLTLESNGSFQFALPVQSGQTYSVSASAQPAGETCFVGNSTGTVGSSAVTDVQVICEPVQFIVFVNVSGLSGGTLVLDDNGSDALTVTGNGTTLFNTELVSGSTYNVTVAQQPGGQTCTVTHGTGTISNNDVLATVTCGSGSLDAGSGSSNCPFPSSFTSPPPFDSTETFFQANDGPNGADLISFAGFFNTATCNPCVQFETDVFAGGGSATPDFPTLAPNSNVALGSNVDIDAELFQYTTNGTASTVQSAYLATSGTMSVNAIGTLGETFSGSVFEVTFTHFNYDQTTNMFTGPAADGCTTTVTMGNFSGTEAAFPTAPAARLAHSARFVRPPVTNATAAGVR